MENVTLVEARKIVDKRRNDQTLPNSSISDTKMTSSKSGKEHCSTCELLAKKLFEKFPDMANELKSIVPDLQLPKPTKQNRPTSKPNRFPSPKTQLPSTKEKPAPIDNKSKPVPEKRNSVQKLSKPQTSSPAQKPQTSKPSQPTSPKKRNSAKQNSKPTKECSENPPIHIQSSHVPLSNRYDYLQENSYPKEAMEEEELEGELSDSEFSPSQNDWDKHTESWSTSKAETEVKVQVNK